VHFDHTSHVFKIYIPQNTKYQIHVEICHLNNICVQDVLVLSLLCLNWWLDMVIKDRQHYLVSAETTPNDGGTHIIDTKDVDLKLHSLEDELIEPDSTRPSHESP
jgi:hypothetical protein